MKHMWSEEEIQELIEEQGGSGGSGSSTLDGIVDSKGNKRFIEGDLTLLLTPEEMERYGATIKYSKWSLSGTHLMIVACLSFTKATQQTPDIKMFAVNLPNWIKEKIKPVFDTYLISHIIAPKYPNGNLSSDLYIGRDNQITLNLTHLIDYDITANCTVRYQFDLLIDTD